MRQATAEQFAEAYSHYPLPAAVYAKRAALFTNFPDPIMVVGCGFGGLVKELLNLGKNAWGMDVSQYAIDHAVTDRCLLLSILDDPHPLGKFATVVTEDLLPWLTDDEARVAAKNCSALGGIVIHLVTEQGEADYNYHTTGYWMTLTNQPVISLEGM